MPTRLLPLLLLGGCLGPKALDSGDGTDPGDDGAPTAYDVNDGTIAVGEIVTLEGLVVTSPVTRDGEGFFVADPAGGAGSGLYVWGPDQVAGLGESVAQGAEVTVTGSVTDYFGWIELQLGNVDDLEVTGEATVPDPVDLGDGEGVDWSQYESVLVTLSDQTITGMDQYSTASLSSGVMLDDGFFYPEHDCGGHYEGVTGIVFYSYETWSVNPRVETDLSGYTSGGSAEADVVSVQQGSACGTVELTGLVVTSPVAYDGEDSLFFVQDAGGEYDGVAVFVPGAELDLEVGNVVDVTGSVSEYYGFTEVYVSDVAAVVRQDADRSVNATTLSEAPADWEPYEGVLVTLTGVQATGDASEYGQVPTNYGINLDDLFVDVTASDGDSFSEVTGLLYYSYEEWNLEPRTAADLVAE